MNAMSGQMIDYAIPSLPEAMFRDDATINLSFPNISPPAHPSMRGRRAWIRRIIDITIATSAIIFMSPLLLAIACITKLTDRGPILFGHQRIGQGGRKFHCWKFRTMVIDAERRLEAKLASDPAARLEWETDHKLRCDPRVTTFGRFLRKSSLDELPQLLNVITGQMSLVGPRPIVEAEIRKYGQHYVEYTQVRPGITGLWQVSGRNHTTYRRRVALDTVYVRNWSLRMDIAILLRTIKVVLTSHGAF